MKERKIKNGIFRFACTWFELNSQDAAEATTVVICTDSKRVAVYYATTETQFMTDAQIAIVRDLAIENGMDDEKLEFYGIIDPLDTPSIHNTGNMEIVH